MTDFDTDRIFQIPRSSQISDVVFTQEHLQRYGLLNDGNVCALISVFLSFHRIGLKYHLIDPHFCFTLSRHPDFPSWVFMKILSAMPSTCAFSLQLFIKSWNHARRSPMIEPGYADVSSLLEGIVSNLQVKQYSNRPPVFTQILASFKCTKCGLDHVKVRNWVNQIQASVPLLQLPENDESVNVIKLLDDHLKQTFQTRCSNLGCRSRIMNARLEVEVGFYTVVAVNRSTDPTRKQTNRLSVDKRSQMFDPGNLVSIVSHKGDVNSGHFVSYHRVGDTWFLNDDSRMVTMAEDPLNPQSDTETVEILFFINQ